MVRPVLVAIVAAALRRGMTRYASARTTRKVSHAVDAPGAQKIWRGVGMAIRVVILFAEAVTRAKVATLQVVMLLPMTGLL